MEVEEVVMAVNNTNIEAVMANNNSNGEGFADSVVIHDLANAVTNTNFEAVLANTDSIGEGSTDSVVIQDLVETEIVGDCDSDIDISGSLLGVTKKTLEETYDLYRRHSCAVGFSIRRNTTRTENGVVMEKYYVCSYEGEMRSKRKLVAVAESSEGKKKRTRRVPFTRSKCGASIRFRLNGDGLYQVISHVVAHNHPLTRTEWQHLHRSERNIQEEKGATITVMIEAAVKPAVQYRYMCEEYGGEEVVGHSVKDHFNFVNRLKMKAIEGGDAQSVIDKLNQRASEEPEFFYRVKLDDCGRLCNVFWRDSMMKEDYRIYGDVTVFDTTYRTNKYNLICGAFVGINNHWKNVMFGCAFLGDEKTPSFEWLFEVFKKSMEGVSPVSIFTDQDLAMSNAIGKVFPNSRHRLCQWHLQQNAVSHFGSLKQDTTFKNAFDKCLKGCYNEAEFEVCWNNMVTTYGLVGDEWFDRLYGLRYKWSTALSKDFFSAGILSSQRSEATNSSIGFHANKTTSLTELYAMFNATVKRWRRNEQQDEFDCSRSVPASYLPMVGLLKHASQVYTHRRFRDFEQEFGYAMGTRASVVYVDDTTMVYDVSLEDNPQSAQRVTYDCVNTYITCSCGNFEEAGWLCCHCIRVLHLHSVSEIPNRYISKRWTKFAKTEVWDKLKQQRADRSELKKDCIPWRYEMTRSYYNLVLKCHENGEARKIVETSYNQLLAAIEEFFSHLSVSESSSTVGRADVSAANSSSIVLDPHVIKTKGRKPSRKKNHFERSNKHRHCSNSNAGNEFGSRTPTARLF